MFVAYAIPREDHHLVVEDGIHFLAVGSTKDEALASLRNRFEKEHAEDNQRSVELGYDPEPLRPIEEDYAIHVDEA